MAGREEEWPEVGELVIATVEEITTYGAYVLLDEFNKQGLLHISEISSTWVRNIRTFVRERQKVILKVLRVDRERGHVDLSLRRVSGSERKEKLFLWKRSRTAESLLRSASEKLKIPIQDIYSKTEAFFENEPSIYEGLERAARDGADVLLDVGIKKDIAVTIAEIAKDKLTLPLVKIQGILELTCAQPNGVYVIRDALSLAQKVKKPLDSTINIYVVAAPRYRIEVSAKTYKDAEKILNHAVEIALKNITNTKGQGTFTREK